MRLSGRRISESHRRMKTRRSIQSALMSGYFPTLINNCSSAEIVQGRLGGQIKTDESPLTQDCALYRVLDDQVWLYLLRYDNVVTNPSKAFKQFVYKNHYRIDQRSIEKLVCSNDIIPFDMSKLRLTPQKGITYSGGNVYSYLRINTQTQSAENTEFNKTESSLAKCVFGDDFKSYMALLDANNISQNAIMLYNPPFVKHIVKEGNGIIQLCRLYSLRNSSSFDATVGSGELKALVPPYASLSLTLSSRRRAIISEYHESAQRTA